MTQKTEELKEQKSGKTEELETFLARFRPFGVRDPAYVVHFAGKRVGRDMQPLETVQ